jgi:hypothetical protein
MIMAGGIVIERRVADAPALAARKRFRGYKPEPKKATREADVKESEANKQIKDVWNANPEFYYPEYDDYYKRISAALKDLRITAKDVEYFSLALAEFQHEQEFDVRAGVFLSALINRGKESDYVIHTQHITMPLSFIGFKNEKNIIVDGDVGDRVGCEMRDGSITVNGYAGTGIGTFMRGGSITVNGNAGTLVGDMMKSGEIRLKGDYRYLGLDMKEGGRVYHQGKLIFPGKHSWWKRLWDWLTGGKT